MILSDEYASYFK